MLVNFHQALVCRDNLLLKGMEWQLWKCFREVSHKCLMVVYTAVRNKENKNLMKSGFASQISMKQPYNWERKTCVKVMQACVM